MARSARTSDWMSNLPLVLLGIRTSTRDDSAISPAHLVYGAPLRLPGEFFSPERLPHTGASDFVAHLQQSIRNLVPFPADFHGGSARSSQVPAVLTSCPAVFVRVDAVKRPLTPPYVGPFEVLERQEKTFIVKKAGKPWTVSVDRLKPFFAPVMSAPPATSCSATSPPPPAATSQCVLPPAASSQCASPPAAPSISPSTSASPSSFLSAYSTSPSSSPSTSPPAPALAPAPAPAPDVVTRAGRTVRPPDRFSA